MNEKKIFTITTSGKSGINAPFQTTALNGKIDLDIPVEFQGPGRFLSPEDLYAASLGNCFLATFKVIAEKSKLEFESIECHVELIVDVDDNLKKLIMKKANLVITLSGVLNTDRAMRLLVKTPENCMILNSVKTELSFDYKII